MWSKCKCKSPNLDSPLVAYDPRPRVAVANQMTGAHSAPTLVHDDRTADKQTHAIPCCLCHPFAVNPRSFPVEFCLVNFALNAYRVNHERKEKWSRFVCGSEVFVFGSGCMARNACKENNQTKRAMVRPDSNRWWIGWRWMGLRWMGWGVDG